MNDHPTPEELEGVAWNRVPPGRVREILLHILNGCASCKAALAPHFGALLGLAEPPEPVLTAQEEERVRRRGRPRLLHRARPGAGAARGAAARGRRRRRLRDDPPRAGAAPGGAAVRVPPPTELGPPPREPRGDGAARRAGARARRVDAPERPLPPGPRPTSSAGPGSSWATPTGWRTISPPPSGPSAGHRAVTWRGRQDELLAARLFSVQASLLSDGRRFNLAETALDLVFGIHQRRGDPHEAGRALLKKGIVAGYQGRPEEALQLIDAGASSGSTRSATPVWSTWRCTTRPVFLLDTGQLREARIALWQARARGLDPGGRVNELKVRWLEGRINLALGELERAEAAFREVKLGFADARPRLQGGPRRAGAGRGAPAPGEARGRARQRSSPRPTSSCPSASAARRAPPCSSSAAPPSSGSWTPPSSTTSPACSAAPRTRPRCGRKSRKPQGWQRFRMG